MDVFTMVAIIVVAGCLAGIVTTWLETRAKEVEHGAGQADIDRMNAEIEKLQDRVRILEKLATDEEARLREQISRLA